MMPSPIDVSDLAVLSYDANRDYLTRPLPCARDGEIGQLLDRLWHQPQLAAAQRLLKPNHEWGLCWFAERMASLTVRRRQADDLRRGLLAAALAVPIGDARDVLRVLSLLWRSAEHLALEPAREFTAVAEMVGGQGGELLRSFVRRSPENRRIEVMGYREGADEGGFRYIDTLLG